MLDEINKDFYCSGDFLDNTYKRNFCTLEGAVVDIERDCSRCARHHRKHPTPEQFKEEYGKEVPDDFPVWFIIPEDKNDNFHDWTLMVYAEALQYEREEEEADFLPDIYIVCASTPFGKPDKDWRP